MSLCCAHHPLWRRRLTPEVSAPQEQLAEERAAAQKEAALLHVAQQAAMEANVLLKENEMEKRRLMRQAATCEDSCAHRVRLEAERTEQALQRAGAEAAAGMSCVTWRLVVLACPAAAETVADDRC